MEERGGEEAPEKLYSRAPPLCLCTVVIPSQPNKAVPSGCGTEVTEMPSREGWEKERNAPEIRRLAPRKG